MGAAGLVLLIACANIACLQLSRGTTRVTELALRAAIGAGRGRLVRQLFTENILIAVAGGVAGVLLARWTRHLLVAIAPKDIPRLAETGLDFPVLLFASVLSLTTGLIFGMAPVITACRIDLSTALKAGARTLGGDEPRQYARSVLVVGEVALTFVLVFGAGLLLRSLIAAQNATPGVDARPILSLELRLPGSSYTGADMVIMIRTAGDPETLIPSVRGVVSGIDRNLPIQRLAGLERTLGASLARRRFSTLLLTVFAGLAVLLAIVGIYGLPSYWVSVREREIGIRLALGARPSVIVRWTSLQALRLAAIGMAFGVLGAWAAARGLEDLVFGIPPRSATTMIASAVAVTVIAALAATIPAWRAARVDAASQLHQ